MVVACSKLLFNSILKSCGSSKCIIPILRTSQFSTSSAKNEASKENLSRAMRVYLERVKKHEEFVKEQLEQFNLGKKHLANMMGKDVKSMTQDDIDEAIEYLFPSGLFVPKARPMMKPPEELVVKQKAAQFDYTGRPFHYLFYTVRPNFCELLHDAAKHLQSMNEYERGLQKAGMESQPSNVSFLGSDWFSKEKLEAKLLEKLYKVDYENFIDLFERLASHPCSFLAEKFIRNYRTQYVDEESKEKITPTVCEDGSLLVKISGKRKTAIAEVDVIYPGKGKIMINNTGIDYFQVIDSRKQVILKF